MTSSRLFVVDKVHAEPSPMDVELLLAPLLWFGSDEPTAIPHLKSRSAILLVGRAVINRNRLDSQRQRVFDKTNSVCI
jgi:hypothetical protein